jgi:hypothetical protein
MARGRGNRMRESDAEPCQKQPRVDPQPSKQRPGHPTSPEPRGPVMSALMGWRRDGCRGYRCDMARARCHWRLGREVGLPVRGLIPPGAPIPSEVGRSLQAACPSAGVEGVTGSFP